MREHLLLFARIKGVGRGSEQAVVESKLSQLDLWQFADKTAGSLSGGNAQKLILSREINDKARLIIAAQPTRGLDIGATAFVWDVLREARARGCGILFVSSDLDEIFDISDRVAVMVSGRVQDIFQPPFEIDKVGAAMTGAGK